jgi:hypothetical protein
MNEKGIRNRRMRYCDAVLRGPDSDYFSEAEMRRRDPSGFSHYMGADRQDAEPQEGLGGWFLKAMDKQQARFVEAAQDQVDAVVETSLRPLCGPMDEGDYHEESEADRLQALRELHRVRFVAGEDAFFDYAVVDQDDRWDDARQRRIDDEEKWFEGDD